CLEVDVRDRAPVVHRLRKLERPFDVLARSLEVTLMAAAARAPAEDVRAQQVARETGAIRQRERLVQQRDRGRDARELVPAHAEAEEYVGASDVVELRPFHEHPSVPEQLDRLAKLPELGQRPCLPGEAAGLELGEGAQADLDAHDIERLASLLVATRFEQRFGARERRLDAVALIRVDPRGEEADIDAEALREPGGRLSRRARLPALDLRDVLLRE